MIPVTMPVTLPIHMSVNVAEIISCPAVTTMLKKGSENLVKEVANVQSILKNIEHMDVAVTGDYDDRTEAAVRAFQLKYAREVLGPWGATKASGVVSLTTGKMLNKVGCLKPLTLSDGELSFIRTVRAKAEAAEGVGADIGINQGGGTEALVPSAEAASGGVAGAAYYDNTASALGGGSTIQRFASYLKHLFR